MSEDLVKQMPVRQRARAHLVVTAERLFAVHGVEGVSMRRIAAEAGYRNPSTIQYHFGTKEALVEAILEHRLTAINDRRLELLAVLEPQGLRGVVEAMVRPLLEQDADSHYVEFLARLIVDMDRVGAAYASSGEVSRSGRALRAAFDRLLDHLPKDVRDNRVQLGTVLVLNGIAIQRRRRLATGRRGLPAGNFEQELIDAMVAVLNGAT